MPTGGIRMISSKMRHEMKRKPEMAMAAVLIRPVGERVLTCRGGLGARNEDAGGRSVRATATVGGGG